MANIRISQLPSAQTAITGNELVPIVQNGETVQTTISAIVNSPVQTQTFLTKNNEPTLPNSRYLAVGAGLSLADGGAQSTYSITPVGALASLVNAGQGFMVKSSGTSLVNRSIAISGNGLSIVNSDGTTGNPTIALTNNVANLAGASGTGLLAIAGNNSLSTVTIAGTTNQIVVTNGNTSPVIGLSNNPVIPGTASLTLPIGGTALRPSGVNGMIRYNTDLNALEVYANNVWGTVVSGSGVSSFSAGTTGLTPSSGTTGVVVLAGTLNASSGGTGSSGALTGITYANGTSAYTSATTAQLLTLLGTTPIANGGTGQTTASSAFNALSPITTTGDLIYGSATNTASRLPIGSTNQVLTVVGGIPAWVSVSGVAVTSFSAGSTGLSPASPTTGAITLSGTLAVANGGTGATTLTGYVYGNGTSAMTASTTIPNTAIIGLGTMSTQNANSVAITGGTIQGVGLTIDSLDNTPIGSTTPSTAKFTTLSANSTVTLGNYTGYVYANGAGAITASTTIPTSALSGTISLTTQVSGILPIANGGTGLSSIPINGALDIGNGAGFTRTTLTAGTGISITNGAGSITTSITATGVTAGTYGSSSVIPVLTINAQGQVTSISTQASNAPAYQGTWNANTNSPTLTSSVGTAGYYYVVTTAGNTTLNGVSGWNIGDWAIFSNGAWQKIPGSTTESFTNLITTNLQVGGLTGFVYANNTTGYATAATTAQLLSLLGTTPVANGGTGITSFGTGVQTALGQNVTGSGGFALAVSPSLTTPILGVATATSLTIGTLTYTPANALLTAQSSATAYNQVIIQNSNNGATASADYIVNNNNSTDFTYYGDFGMNSGGFTGSGAFNAPNTVYLTATTGDLAIGTTTANAIHFVVSGGTTDSATVNGTTGIWTYASTINGSITGNAGTLTLSAGSGATNYITYSSSATGNVSQFTSSGLTYNATNNAITGGINGGTF